MDPPAIHELIHQLVAKPLNIHLAPSTEPSQPLFQLRRTGWINAAYVRSIRLLLNFCTARWALPGRFHRLGAARSFFGNDLHHVGNDLPGALQDHGVSQVQIEALDLIDVV